MSVERTLLQRAEYLPSNSDSQTNKNEYVLNKGKKYPKDVLDNCQKPSECKSQNDSEGHKTFSTLGHIFAKPKDPIPQSKN